MEPTTMIAYAIVTMIISYAITTAMMPRPPNADAATFDDFDFPQADEGTPQAVVFGDCWSGDWTVLAVGNYRTSAIRKSGGKK